MRDIPLKLVLVIALVLTAGSVVGPAWRAAADDPETDASAGSQENETAEPESPPPAPDLVGTRPVPPDEPHPIFIPPNRGAPKHTVGLGTRGATRRPLGAPGIRALVPDQGGLTLMAGPTLYWHLANPVAEKAELRVVLEHETGVLLETVVPGPLESGIHGLRLTDRGVRLEPELVYEWLVMWVPDPKRSGILQSAGGTIERIEPTDELSTQLSVARERAAFRLARAGIWYDALDALSQQVDAAPGDAVPRLHRAAILEQVGLLDVALAERAAAGEAHRE